MTQIGICFRRVNPTRRDEYAIYESTVAYGHPIVPPVRYVQYVGYREVGASGEVWVGLPLGGPGWRGPQPLLDFNERAFETVRFWA